MIAGPDSDFQLGNLGPGEWTGLTATLFGDLAVEHEAALAALGALDPPEAFAADHARLIALVTEDAGTVASVAEDAAAGTLQALRFDDQRMLGLARGACVAFCEMSPEFRATALLVAPGDDPEAYEDCDEIGLEQDA